MAKVHGQPWIYLQQQQQHQQGSFESLEGCFPSSSHGVVSSCTRFPSAAESDPSSSMSLAAAAAYCDNKFYDLDYHDPYELHNLVKYKSSAQMQEAGACHLGFPAGPALLQQPSDLIYTSRSTDFQLSVAQQDQAFLQQILSLGDFNTGSSTIVHTSCHVGYQDPCLNAAAYCGNSVFAALSPTPQQQQGPRAHSRQQKSSPSSSSSEIVDGPVLLSSSSSSPSSKRRRLMPSEEEGSKKIQHAQQQQSWISATDQCVPVVVTAKKNTALNTNFRPRARQGSANDPQSIAARHRRERISDRLKILQELIPNSAKVDLVTMLEKAINYVKFLQLQVKVLTADEYWPDQNKDKASLEA